VYFIEKMTRKELFENVDKFGVTTQRSYLEFYRDRQLR
jgi:hypothetical protein